MKNIKIMKDIKMLKLLKMLKQLKNGHTDCFNVVWLQIFFSAKMQ